MKLTKRQQEQQALRLKRNGLAALTYLFILICIQIVDWSLGGPIHPKLWLYIISIGLAGSLGFMLLVKSNINLKFSDPSMTRAQIFFSASWGLLGVISLYEVRGLVLMLYLPSFLFGSLKLNRREYLELVVMVSLLLLAGLLFELTYLRPNLNLRYELFLWFTFTLLLTWFALFGSYLNGLRRKLSLAKVDLEETHRELSIASAKLKAAAETDYLTGALTRRALYDEIAQIDAKSAQPFSIVIADIDKFKQINDTYGHNVGDLVLVEVVQRIRSILRSHDLLARWGGEEFLIVLIGVAKKQAVDIVKRLNQSFVDQAIIIEGTPITVSLSEGLIEVDSLDNFDNVLKRADKLLYQAKNKGRNRLETVPDIDSSPN